MTAKRIAGIVILIIGAALILIANYMNGRIGEGRNRISHAQEQVDTGNALFSLHPATKQVGKEFTGSAQRQIDDGRQEVRDYEEISKWLQIGGIALAVLGIGVIILGGKPSRRR